MSDFDENSESLQNDTNPLYQFEHLEKVLRRETNVARKMANVDGTIGNGDAAMAVPDFIVTLAEREGLFIQLIDVTFDSDPEKEIFTVLGTTVGPGIERSGLMDCMGRFHMLLSLSPDFKLTGYTIAYPDKHINFKVTPIDLNTPDVYGE